MDPYDADLERRATEVLRNKAVEALKGKLDENKALWLTLYALWRRAERLEAEIESLKRGIEKLYDTAEIFAQLRKAFGECYDRAMTAPKETDAKKAFEKIAEGLINTMGHR